MSHDQIDHMLRQLSGGLPQPSKELSEEQKDELIRKVGGVLTTENIIKAQKDYPRERIPFLFSGLDTQAVVDILNHDMKAAIARAHSQRNSKKANKISKNGK